ncbi:hypothetical protein FKB03_23325, partial [Salmonella enterica subsp. enterica serovar Typhimurium]
MPVLISGVLKDGTGTPVQNCTIQLKACRTSTTVVVNTVASENPDDAGRYSMDVEQGQYTVTLLVEGYPPSHAGVITVYDDSKPGTLNDFLGAMTEDDVRPEALRRFEAMVEEVARQASEASRNATAAGQATPVQNCTIQLKACRTSTTVVVNTVASENPDDAGRYSMDVEQGQYTVTLLVDGYPPSHAGVITVYDDSKPGTLNDFLGAMTEDDVRPEALRRFEAMVEEVARQASEASRNATAAGQASEQAQTSAGQASESATAAVNAAGAAEASATQAASSAASAESSAGTATTKAGEASASAASADTARTAAAASAAAAKTSEANADASRTAAGDSAAAAAASATAAQTSAERAGASETAAKTSETQAASSAGDAGASATAAAASEKAAAASAAAAKTSETNAATSASTAAASATAASSSASEASTHAAASDTSASLAAQSSTAAGAAATRAEDAAKRAEDIADVISLEDASLTKKGIVKLSSATDSDSEALAATPKAVHAVMDEVQTKAPLDSP